MAISSPYQTPMNDQTHLSHAKVSSQQKLTAGVVLINYGDFLLSADRWTIALDIDTAEFTNTIEGIISKISAFHINKDVHPMFLSELTREKYMALQTATCRPSIW
jgi:hypothetical protein